MTYLIGLAILGAVLGAAYYLSLDTQYCCVSIETEAPKQQPMETMNYVGSYFINNRRLLGHEC